MISEVLAISLRKSIILHLFLTIFLDMHHRQIYSKSFLGVENRQKMKSINYDHFIV